MMRRTALLLTLLASAALQAQAGADPRALESCARDGASFVAIEKCLPDEHVAVTMLDAIGRDRVFGAAGATLAGQCLALNMDRHGYAGAWACASGAVKAALRLGTHLPAGTRLDDPLFEGLDNPDAARAMDEAERAAQGMFPEKTYWGGTMYRPLE